MWKRVPAWKERRESSWQAGLDGEWTLKDGGTALEGGAAGQGRRGTCPFLPTSPEVESLSPNFFLGPESIGCWGLAPVLSCTPVHWCLPSCPLRKAISRPRLLPLQVIDNPVQTGSGQKGMLGPVSAPPPFSLACPQQALLRGSCRLTGTNSHPRKTFLCPGLAASVLRLVLILSGWVTCFGGITVAQTERRELASIGQAWSHDQWFQGAESMV